MRRRPQSCSRVLFIGILLCALCAVSAGARPSAVAASLQLQNPTPQVSSNANAATPPPNTDQGKTEQYTLSHERYEKAVAYSRAGYTLYFLYYLLGFLFLFLILRLGIAARFRDIAENLSDRRWVQGLVFVPLLIGLFDLLELPLEIYWHRVSVHYEQSVQGWGSWIWDWAKAQVLDLFFTLVLALILFAAMRFSPRRWWLYFWFPTVLILFGLMIITPMVIDPLFNKFEPLEKQYPDLVASIGKLTERAGVPIPPDRMFLMIASRKTKAIDAYVTGLGASKRVVLWDTMLQKTSREETLFIVGHELGHYVLNHTLTGFLWGAAGLLVALYLSFHGLYWALDRWGPEWKIASAEDWPSFAVLLLLLHLLVFLSSPAINWVSRTQEHAADVYGLEITHRLTPNSAEVAAHAFQVLGELDLSDPNPPPFVTFWLYSHPPLAERLVFAHNYDPWSKGRPPKYVK